MKLLIPTCDANLWLIPLYQHLFDKYEWGKVFEPIYLGFTKPDFQKLNINFVSMASKQECWSRHIYNYVKSIMDEYVCFTLEDFLPVAPINLDSFHCLLAETLTNNVGRADLTWDLYTNCRCLTYNRNKYQSIYCPKGPMVERESLYRISTQQSIWKREYLLKFLEQDWSPWQFEVEGSKLSLNFEEDVIGLACGYEDYPVKYTPKGAVSRICPGKFNCLGMDIETIREIVEMGFVKETDLIWGMFKGAPTFHEAGGYEFTVDRMPIKPSVSPANWEEWRKTYE